MYTLRHALRTVTKTPWLSLVVISSLAIGIGTNTVIFSWLKNQIFEPSLREHGHSHDLATPAHCFA